MVKAGLELNLAYPKKGGVFLKKGSFIFFLSLILFASFTTPSFASGGEAADIPSAEQQIKDFEKLEEGLKSGKIKIHSDKKAGDSLSVSAANQAVPQGTTGTYPTRKGTILVTDGLRVDSLVGHAGIVLGSGKTIESFPEGGVQYKYDNWTDRYKKVWGITTYGTTASEDAAAADWAVEQKGDPYNWNFFDIENTAKFYCSQLVYKAVKTKTGVNLNWLGGIVTPADLVNDEDSYVIYTFTK